MPVPPNAVICAAVSTIVPGSGTSFSRPRLRVTERPVT